MKSFKLLINPFAELDLQLAKEWYNLQKEELGNEFIQEITTTLTRIKLNPKQFPKIRRDIRKAIVNRFPFGIFFVVHSNTINVFAVFHNSRNPIKWEGRMNDFNSKT